MGFSWTTFSFEVVNFVIFAWLLQRLLYRPLQHAIEARRRARDEAQAEVSQLLERARELEAQITEQRAGLQTERRNALEHARAEAQSQRAGLLTRARDEAQDLRRREEERLALERRQAEAEIATSSLEVARATIEQLLQKLPLPAMDAAMGQELLALVEPADVDAGARTAVVTSARELTTAERELLSRQIERRLGSALQLDFEIEPQLLAGVRLQVGSRLYDASLAAQLDGVLDRARQHMARGEQPTTQAPV